METDTWMRLKEKETRTYVILKRCCSDEGGAYKSDLQQDIPHKTALRSTNLVQTRCLIWQISEILNRLREKLRILLVKMHPQKMDLAFYFFFADMLIHECL